MAYTLSKTQEDLERAVFTSIMNVCTSLGYTADFRNTTLYPDTALGNAALKTAMDLIATTKGFHISVMGSSDADARGLKVVPRIVISDSMYYPGEIGADQAPYYEHVELTDSFNKVKLPPKLANATITVTIIARNIVQKRVLNAILAIAMPDFGYIPRYYDPTVNYFVRRTTVGDTSDPSQGIIENTIYFEIPDLYESDPVIIGSVSPVKQIDVIIDDPAHVEITSFRALQD